MSKKVIKRAQARSVQSTKYLKSQFRNHVATAIIAAFSFLIALSWRDFIIKIVEENTKTNFFTQYPYVAELYTAAIITIIAVLGIALVSKWAKKPEAN